MAKQMTRPAKAAEGAPRARRLTAEARKRSILRAARRAFTETGDMNGTTIKTIAERMTRLGDDPFLGALTDQVTLEEALPTLEKAVAGPSS